MKGWIAPLENETAEELLTRVSALNDYVSTRRDKGSTIAYSADGLILRQGQRDVVKEIRGINEAAAELLEDLETDTTESVTYYKPIGENGEHAVVALVIGEKTSVSSALSTEAGSWTTTIVQSTFYAVDANGWTDERPSSSESDGVLLSVVQDGKFLYGVGTLSASFNLYQNWEIENREFRFLSEDEAREMIEDLNRGNDGQYKNASIFVGAAVYQAVKDYVENVASARYVDSLRGWTVSLKKTTYSPAAHYTQDEPEAYWKVDGENITAAPFCPLEIK